ncbi:hypothetical protein Tco_1401736 [Tanacetum coccineum]
MVACLEKIEGNSDFHEIVDFLAYCSIHHALTQINATVDSKAVVVTEASIRSSLLLMMLMTFSPKDLMSQDLIFWWVLALESIKDAQAIEISALKIRIKRLEKKCKPSISHHRAWLKSVQRLSMKKRFGKKESVSKQGRKKSKPESTLDDSTVFDDQDADHGMEYMETEEAMDEGRQSGETEKVKLTDDTEVIEDKGSGDKGGNVEELVSTARPKVSTDRPDIDAARQEDSVVEPRTSPTPTSIFDDEDITMAQTLIKMKEEKAKEKGVSIKDVDDSSRPERSILTLKPLPTIDPKDKGKGVLKESPVKKVKRSNLDAAQIAKDAEIARLIHEKELAEMEREKEERQRQDQAFVNYITSLYDEVQAKMDARLQMEEERDVHNRRKVKAISKYRHNQLNKKTFEEIQALYIKEQERDADFVPIGSKRDEKMIDKMNKQLVWMRKRKKMKSRKRRFRQGTSKGDKTDSDIEKENDELRLCLTIISNEDEEVDYKILDKKYPIIEWKSEYHGIKPQLDETKDLEEININVMIRNNGQRRYFSTLMRVLSIFDREYLCTIYQPVMNRYQDETLEGFDRVLWGDLMIMFNPTDEDEFWNSQQDWNVYPLRKKVSLQMLELKLESEEDSTMALELIRFVKKLIAELEPKNFDGDGKDL